jgi:hypothetical protein
MLYFVVACLLPSAFCLLPSAFCLLDSLAVGDFGAFPVAAAGGGVARAQQG